MRNLTNRARHWFGLLAAVLVVASGSIWGAGWRRIGNDLPSSVAGASGLAIDPATPSTLYSWGSGGALFKSSDGAATWKIVNGIAGVSWLGVHPKNSSIIYAGTSRGLVKSTDGGESWVAPAPSFVAPLVLDPQDSNTLYGVTFGGGIIKTTDGGASWIGIPGPQIPLRFLTVDPVTPSTLYGIAVSYHGIFKSTDGGENWVLIKAGQGVDFLEIVHALAVDPVTPSIIYASAYVETGPGSREEIIYKSTDGGQNWRKVRAGIPAGASVASLAIDPESPSRIYATYGSSRADAGWGIVKSTDGGESWTMTNAGVLAGDYAVSVVAIDPATPQTLYAAYVDQGFAQLGGIVKSTDGASSWNPANAGRSFIDLRALAIHPMDADTLYTSIGSDGVFKSVDGGESWQKLAAFRLSPGPFSLSGQTYTRYLAIDFLHPNILYALAARIEGGCGLFDELVLKSTDSGASWSTAGPPMSGCAGLSAIAMDPTDPNTLYVSGIDIEGEYPDTFKTTDGGASWSGRRAGCYDNALLIDPTNPASLYCGTAAGVVKSIDGGGTWTETSLNTGVNVLALDPANPSVLYAATGGSGLSGFKGLFKSVDGGESWTPINEGLASLIASRSPVSALVIDPASPQTLYAGTSGYGVFRSTDGGAHWEPFNDGLPNLDIRLLALTPGRALYAGTGSGIFVWR